MMQNRLANLIDQKKSLKPKPHFYGKVRTIIHANKFKEYSLYTM